MSDDVMGQGRNQIFRHVEAIGVQRSDKMVGRVERRRPSTTVPDDRLPVTTRHRNDGSSARYVDPALEKTTPPATATDNVALVVIVDDGIECGICYLLFKNQQWKTLLDNQLQIGQY